jgi:hypothetical protein
MIDPDKSVIVRAHVHISVGDEGWYHLPPGNCG